MCALLAKYPSTQAQQNADNERKVAEDKAHPLDPSANQFGRQAGATAAMLDSTEGSHMTKHWRSLYLSKIRSNQAQLKLLGDQIAVNYMPHYLLVEAERARAQLAADKLDKFHFVSSKHAANQSNNTTSSQGADPRSSPNSSQQLLSSYGSRSLHVGGASSQYEAAVAKVSELYQTAFSACSSLKSSHSSNSFSKEKERDSSPVQSNDVPHLCLFGMATELSARFHLDQGHHGQAVNHMLLALTAFTDWGADRKRQLLIKEFPMLSNIKSGDGQSNRYHRKNDLMLVRSEREVFKFHDNADDGDDDSNDSSTSEVDRSNSMESSSISGNQHQSFNASPSISHSINQSQSISYMNTSVQSFDGESTIDIDTTMVPDALTSRTLNPPSSTNFDLKSVLSAIQALSSELRLDRLLGQLMHIVLTNSGGEKGLLLSRSEHVTGRNFPRVPKMPMKDPLNPSSDPFFEDELQESDDDDTDDEREESWVVEAHAHIRDNSKGLPSVRQQAPFASPSSMSNPSPHQSQTHYPTALGSHHAEVQVGDILESTMPNKFRQNQSVRGISDPSTQAAQLSQPSSRTEPGSNGSSPSSARSAPQSVDTTEADKLMYPNSVVNYVINSRKSVILSDASSDRRFSSDPYIQSRKIKSILCTPLIHRAKLVSVLYLENNTSTSTFSTERLIVCRLLVQQAAISIDNARLYATLQSTNFTLEQKVAQRTNELEQAMKLANEANIAKSQFLVRSHAANFTSHHSLLPLYCFANILFLFFIFL